MEIETIADLQKRVIAGEANWKQYGDVITQTENGLILFNYSPIAVFAGRWNFFEQISRGLILDRVTGEVVARPFYKFWNWLEGGRRAGGHIVNVTEKMDGSLGILYRTEQGYKIATRGSMHSEQALWATNHLQSNTLLDDLPTEYTLLFEVIYPENRVVVDYKGRSDLVLLAVRNRFTGEFLPFFPAVIELAANYGFSLPQTYKFNDLTQIIEQCGTLDIEHEGFVVEFSDGGRFKFKGDRYLELHRLIASISYRNTLRAIAGGSIQGFLNSLPDEFLDDVRRWKAEIEQNREIMLSEIEQAFADAPKETRKDFALHIQKHHRAITAYLFARLDNKPLDPLIYKALEDRKDEKVLIEDY